MPCGPVLSTGEILSSSAIRERGAIVSDGRNEVLRNPMRFDGLDLRLSPAPKLGEHTEQVLKEFA